MDEFYRIPVRELLINNCTRKSENTGQISHRFTNFNTVLFLLGNWQGWSGVNQYYLSANVPVTGFHLNSTTTILDGEEDPVFV